MAFDFRDLTAPVSVAPMAGGPSTPELAAAGTDAGGLGFVAAGYLGADAFADRLGAAMRLASGPIGANLFVPGPDTGSPEIVERYAAQLAPDADRYGAAVGTPRIDDDAWQGKLDVLLDLRPAVASFTFGLPTVEEIARLRGAGITVAGTVTTVAEARAAADRGVDVLVAQGPAAGGHRGTFDSQARPAEQSLDDLLASIVATLDLPVVAAGGLMTAADIARVRRAGAVAAQLGTAFLLADEAGSSPVHRAALVSPEFTETVVTKAFSGRFARGLRNRFVDDHDAQAPLAYPQVHYLTSPLRVAAVRAGDPHGTNIWAGTGFRLAEPGPVAAIIEKLTSA
ncbi:nitronate monooxygenase [Mycolicibacterium obuense]|uniref:Propionate 3-nitronate monooxygenase n=1 Tax=Mycolicibacterium obuense TaxID=1807 RepID=A0A0M2K2W2_9MYCO|nr:nitronate monooxygenase [Mycolicibacterium obuense]KKF03702.1 2-nitropropane dioxygenase [Mycolicibacterium obuense]